MKKILSLLLMLFTIQQFSFSQDQHLIDSLEAQLKNHNATKLELQIKSPSLYDTTAANILSSLSKAHWGNNPEKAMEYANQCLSLSEQIGFKKGMGNAYNNMGWVTGEKGDYVPALEFHKKALKIREEIGDRKGVAGTYNNMGVIYWRQGNYPEALKNQFASLKIKEEAGDRKGIASSYNNIGLNYGNQGNYPEALKNLFASLKIYEEIGDKDGIAGSYTNIGVIYREQGNYPEALKNFLASLKISEETGNKLIIGHTYNNIGNIYEKQGNYPKALKNYFAGLKIKEELGDKNGIAATYNSLGKTYTKEKKYKDAAEYLNKSLSLAKEIGSLEYIKSSYEGLATLDSAQGNFKLQVEHYKLFITFRDSIANNENTKKTVALQMSYDFGKKQDSLNAVQATKDTIAQKELQKQKLVRNGFTGGFVLVMMVLFFVYRNYKNQRVANRKLKAAQDQLVKSERMAAFGVMASRVAHEIQNPLNFVNNFSELSEEIVDDVIKSVSEEEKKQNAELLIANLQKINEHGKRAATIVKQLQEHSIKGTAQEFFETKQQ